MNPKEILPQEMWELIFADCRLQDVPALSKAFGSVFNEAAAWIIGDKSAVSILKQIVCIKTVITIRDARKVIDWMKKHTDDYDVDFEETFSKNRYEVRVRNDWSLSINPVRGSYNYGLITIEDDWCREMVEASLGM